MPPKPPVMEHINAFFKTGDTPNCQYPKSAVANVVTIEHAHAMNKYFIICLIFISFTERFAVTFQKSDLQGTVDFLFILLVQLVRQMEFLTFFGKVWRLVRFFILHMLRFLTELFLLSLFRFLAFEADGYMEDLLYLDLTRKQLPVFLPHANLCQEECVAKQKYMA
jgi:hypothetical protein